MKRLLAFLLILLLPAAALADAIELVPVSQESLALISLAPDGQVGLYAAEDGLAVVHADGRVLPVTISQTRGVADDNGNLRRIASQGVRAIGTEGLEWSPDGRYAALVNQSQVVMYLQFAFDPIVLDTQTGELFLAATYGNKPFGDGNGAVLTACFSEDSRYLYALIHGVLDGKSSSIVQYDLETLEAVSLYAGDGDFLHSWPHLSRLRDGSFLVLTDQTKQNRPAGVNRIVPEGGAAAVNHADFTQPIAYFYPRSLQYSRESSYALVLGYSQPGEMYFSRLLRLRPDEGELAKDEYWEIPSLEADRVAVLTGNEMQSPSSVYIQTMCLSPDGGHALLVCVETGTYALRMLNLEDGSLTPVTGVDSDTLRSMCMARAPYLDWSGSTILLGRQGMAPTAYQIGE